MKGTKKNLIKNLYNRRAEERKRGDDERYRRVKNGDNSSIFLRKHSSLHRHLLGSELGEMSSWMECNLKEFSARSVIVN